VKVEVKLEDGEMHESAPISNPATNDSNVPLKDIKSEDLDNTDAAVHNATAATADDVTSSAAAAASAIAADVTSDREPAAGEAAGNVAAKMPSMADDFGDFGDSDDELLNKEVAPDNDKEAAGRNGDNRGQEDGVEPEPEFSEAAVDKTAVAAAGDNHAAAPTAATSEDDEDSREKAKLADALGVDWSQLLNLQKQQKEEQLRAKEENDNAAAVAAARRAYWTPIAIFNRIGLSKRLMGDKYEETIKMIEQTAQEGEKLELLHPVAGIHCAMRSLREKRKNLFKVGPFARAISAREDIALRRELLNLPEEEYSPTIPNTDMEIYQQAVQQLNK